MKRVLPVVLIISIILMLSMSAFAFSFDFSSYSDEELIELETALQKEKLDRGMAKSANIPSGTYTIGEDIPAGVYSVEMAKGQSMGMISTNGGMGDMYVLTSDNPTIGKITLKEGDTFETYTAIVLTLYSGGIVFN